jgi:hypothetical protein
MTVDTYKKAVAVIDHFNSIEVINNSEELVKNWFPESLFVQDCKTTHNNGATSDLREAMGAYKVRPFVARFSIESVSHSPGAWAQIKIQSTYTDAADETNSVSYPQLYTFCFDGEGKVMHYIILNDLRDVMRLVEAMAPIAS